MSVKINQLMCIGCGVCAEICPAGAIKMNENNKAEIDDDLCAGCLACVRECSRRAISEKKETTQPVKMPEDLEKTG